MNEEYTNKPLNSVTAAPIHSPIPLPTQKTEAVPIVLQIIKKLGEQGVDPGEEFHVVATHLGVNDPKAIFTQHLGNKVLIKGYEGNPYRTRVIIEALGKAKNLTLKERYELVQILSAPYENPGDFVKTYLDTLELSDPVRKFCQIELSLMNGGLLKYLPLITDRNFYEKMDPGRPVNDQVILFLSSLKDRENNLILDKEDRQSFLPIHKNRISFIGRVLKDRDLASLILPMYNCDHIEAVLKTYQDTLELTKNEMHSLVNTLANHGLLIQFQHDEHKMLFSSQVIESVISFPKTMSPQLLEAMAYYIPSPLSGEFVNKITTRAPKLEGFSDEETRGLLNKLMIPGQWARPTLYLLKALYNLPMNLIKELPGKNRKEAIIHLLKSTQYNSVLSNDQKRQLLCLLDKSDWSRIIQTEYPFIMGDAAKTMKFSELFEELIQNKEIKNEILDTHLKTLKMSPEDISQWKGWWNESPCPISGKALENLTLMLPLLSNKESFEKAAASKGSPLLALMGEAMKIAGPDQTPLVVGTDINKFLGDTFQSTYITMLVLACQNSLCRPLLSSHTNFVGELALDKEKFDSIMSVCDDPKLAVVWTLTYTSRKKDPDIINRFIKFLSAQEKGRLLEFMLKNKEFWNQSVFQSLTEDWQEKNPQRLYMHRSNLPLNSIESEMENAEVEVADKSAVIKSALKEMNLNEVGQNRIVQAILGEHSEIRNLWPEITPYLPCLAPADTQKIQFDGTLSQLLVSLVICILQKKNEKYAPSTMNKIKILSSLPDDIILKLNTAIMNLPEASSKILQDLCRMSFITLDYDRYPPNSWEPYTKSQLQRFQIETKDMSDLQREMSKRWEQIKTQKLEEVSASWLEIWEKQQGWSPFKILGRTLIYRNSEGKYLAVKWQKKGEDVQELFKEAATLEVLQKHKRRLGLFSEYPQPKGVFEFKGPIAPAYFKDVTVPIEAKEGKAVAYVYEFPNDSYFAYLHDPKEGQDPEKVAKEYASARHALIADLFTLAKNGLMMSQLADIFHRTESSRGGRDDQGRFMAMNFLVRNYSVISGGPESFTGIGSGRLHHLEKAVEYVNAGYSGVRDAGDSLLLSQIMQPGFAFTEKYFSTLLRNNPNQAATFILANFLAEYLLVYELIITERMTHFKENQLDWKDPAKVNALATELREGFVNAMRFYSGISRHNVEKFLDNAGIDWERASMQLQFFSRKDEKGYLPYGKPEDFPKEIYGEEVPIVSDVRYFWDPDEGMSDGGDTRHRGNLSGTDPVKEPEKGRAIMVTSMLLLDKARNKAEKKCDEANALIAETMKGTPAARMIAAQRALALFQESLEYWPYDKRTFSGMEQAFKILGDNNRAQECRRQKAALVIQNSWEKYLRKSAR